MKLLFSAAAEADFESIGDYTAEFNPNRAVSFVRELRHQCFELRNFPRRSPVLVSAASTEIRRHVYRNYLIFYRVGDREVVILRVLHGATDYESKLFPEG